MLEMLVPLVLCGAALWYAIGVSHAWARAGHGRIIRTWQAFAFGAALVVLLVALATPLEQAADRDLPMHMVQHMLLLLVVPPLLALGAPIVAAVEALPSSARRRAQPLLRGVTRSQARRSWLLWTALALALATLTLAVWHLPALYDAAVRNDGVHALEHISFVATGTLFWWMVLRSGSLDRRGFGVLAVFVASLPASALGVLMTMASSPWYAPYGTGHPALVHQQIAGAIMWGFGGVALAIIAALLFASWLSAMERREERPTEAAVPDLW
ncbi:MAG TPA: cytochrome c oxidase assembly protein [Acidimicrobiia bacterium]|jgi:putative membrane protein